MNAPILVFGMPRSGTTWIGKLFDSHPDTLYRHEPDSLVKLDVPTIPKLEDAPQYRAELERFVASLPRSRDPKVVGKQPLFPKSYESVVGLLAYRTSVLAAKAVGRITRHSPCLFRPTGSGHAQVRLVWKSIESCPRLGVCMDALPDARAIYVVRHPCGFVASQLRGMATRHFPSDAEDADQRRMLKHQLRADIGRRYQPTIGNIAQLTTAERPAWEWLLTQEKVLANAAQRDRVQTVRHGDVCAEPLAVTRDLFKSVGFAWHPKTETFVRASTYATGTGYYSVFRQSQASAERWRTELSPELQDRALKITLGGPARRFFPDAHPAQTASQVVACPG